MVLAIHIAYDVVAKVSHDQIILFVLHVYYVIVLEVYHDQTIFLLVHVDCQHVFRRLLLRNDIICGLRATSYCLRGFL